MELTISNSCPRVPTIFSRGCKALFHENRLIKLTTKDIKSSNNFLSNCSTNKFILPSWLHGEIRFSKSLSSSQHKRDSMQASAHVESDADMVAAKVEAESVDSNSVFARGLLFTSACYKFILPYAMRHAIISAICLSARVLVENPQFFKWSLLIKAFPGLIAIILAHAYQNGINQIIDVNIDRVNKPYLPIPAGDISLNQAWLLVTVAVLTVLLILRLMKTDLITTSLYCFGLLLATLYSVPPFRFKSSSLATVIVIPLISVVKSIGVLYTVRASLGLPFLWRPSVVFITTVPTMFFVVLNIIKDIPDVEGDMKHNIRTFAAKFGPRNILFIGTGILLLNYIGAMAAAIYMPQAFNRYIMLPTHSILAFSLLFQARKLSKANYSKEASAKFYIFIWKLLSAEFLLLPFI